MQKKLLSLMIIINCGFIYGDEKLPVISDEENVEHFTKFNELRSEIDVLKKQAMEKEKEKDEIESLLHIYYQRKKYREKLVDALGDEKSFSAIGKYKISSDTSTTNSVEDKKAKNNGIEAGWIYGVTEPKPNTPCAYEYARIYSWRDGRLKDDASLSQEYTQYQNMVEKEIWPSLNVDLQRRINVVEVSYIPAFKVCDCHSGDEYYRCLVNEGINKEQVSEEFVEKFVAAAFTNAYNHTMQKNIPVTLDELIAGAEKNKITKEAFARLMAAKENLKKAIRRERLDPQPHIDLTGENKEKPSIIEDLKEDQNK